MEERAMGERAAFREQLRRDIRSSTALTLRICLQDMGQLNAGLASMPNMDKLRERIQSWMTAIAPAIRELERTPDGNPSND
jgi:hypothetical protein